MKTLSCLLSVGALLLAPAALHAKIVRTVERTFTVQPGGSLTASTQGGNITVHTADGNEVRVTARQIIRTNDEAEADRLLADLSLSIEQKGNDVVAEAKYERARSGFSWKSWPPVTVEFEITVPRAYHADLRTSGGNVSVASLRGNVKARTSGGNLHFERIDGELEGRTSGGNIHLAEGTARAKLNTSGGNIVVLNAHGPTEVSTSGGGIRIDSASHLISATTSGGSIRANLQGELKQDAVLSTSGGSVSVRVSPDAGFQLDARTSGGSVNASGITLKMDDGGARKGRLSGRVNGGGPVLKLRSSGGSISIRAE